MGFQGDDPTTDFRSAGMLSLKLLLYFGTHYREEMKLCMATFIENDYYHYAVTSIHVTIWTLDYLKSTYFDELLISSEDSRIIGEEIYCHILIKFRDFWEALQN
jgi:hypothetical protein